jgi:hypothetical protein
MVLRGATSLQDKGHWKGWALKIETFLGPEMALASLVPFGPITYRYIMYFFRTFKKSTAPYKVHNMGLRYIK